jgi:hypothetical protein
VKAVYYLSPLLIAPLFLIDRETLRKGRVFVWYAALGLVFYLGLFDFSQGALDKYLMFLIVPLAVLAAGPMSAIGERIAENGKARAALLIAAALAVAVLIFKLNWLPHDVVALYPKSEWFAHVAHLRWNILTPMNGGSGPMGFYVSFLFIAVSFLATIVAAIVARFMKRGAAFALALILFLGIGYNLLFAEEYMFGQVNGSSATVLAQATDFLRGHPQIDHVLTYNDIGARELTELGRYDGRFYAAPQFEAGHREKFAKFAGYYMIVDIPHIYENGFYGQFFARCSALWSADSGRIRGSILSCPRP